MKVTVTYMAQIKQAAGVASEVVELNETCTARKFVHTLTDKHGEALRKMLLDGDELRPTILLFVNDTQITAENDSPLRDGDAVSLLSPIAGG